jgi:hypothetical protein
MIKNLCRTCNKVKEPKDFHYKSQRYNKKGELITYYNLKKCKSCILETAIYKKKSLNYDNAFLYKEAYDFMKYISRVRGYIDPIDIYRLIDHHINTFGYNEKRDDDSFEEIYMDLYKVYKKYKNAE